MIESIFTGFLNFFNSLIGTGSDAADGVYGTVTGSLGNVVGAL
jgi:hypothetical protein